MVGSDKIGKRCPHYTYDANGNLTSDGTTTYTWDARNRLVGVTGAISGSFTYDALGHALVVSNAQGAATTASTYEPFGTTGTTGAASSNPLYFTGREQDAPGLYYYRARYYSPRLGRFLSEDPIRIGSSDLNFYSYVSNAPSNSIDPLGLEKTKKSCFAQNRFGSLFTDTNLEEPVTLLELTALTSIGSDLVAIGIKSQRSGLGGSTESYASGLNMISRAVGKGLGSTALTGTLVALGDVITPVLAVTGAFTGAYDATIMAQCSLGIIN